AGDERVGEGGREAREVRAHRVEAVAPQPRLELPVRLDRDRREGTGQLEGELARVEILVGHSRGSTTPRGWAPARGPGAYHPGFPAPPSGGCRIGGSAPMANEAGVA